MAIRERIKGTSPHKSLNPNSPTHRKIIKARRILKTATGKEVQEKARMYAEDALTCLWEIVNNPVAADVAKISAAATLLDRGYGKPSQTNFNATVNADGTPSQIDEAELNRRINAALSRVEGLTKRKREKIKSEEGPPDLRQLH